MYICTASPLCPHTQELAGLVCAAIYWGQYLNKAVELVRAVRSTLEQGPCSLLGLAGLYTEQNAVNRAINTPVPTACSRSEQMSIAIPSGFKNKLWINAFIAGWVSLEWAEWCCSKTLEFWVRALLRARYMLVKRHRRRNEAAWSLNPTYDRKGCRNTCWLQEIFISLQTTLTCQITSQICLLHLSLHTLQVKLILSACSWGSRMVMGADLEQESQTSAPGRAVHLHCQHSTAHKPRKCNGGGRMQST